MIQKIFSAKYTNRRLQFYGWWTKLFVIYFLTYDNIWKIATGQGGDYTTGCSLDHPYFENYYKEIAIQQLILLKTYVKEEVQQCFSLLKKQKKKYFRFFTKNRESFAILILFLYEMTHYRTLFKRKIFQFPN